MERRTSKLDYKSAALRRPSPGDKPDEDMSAVERFLSIVSRGKSPTYSQTRDAIVRMAETGDEVSLSAIRNLAKRLPIAKASPSCASPGKDMTYSEACDAIRRETVTKQTEEALKPWTPKPAAPTHVKLKGPAKAAPVKSLLTDDTAPADPTSPATSSIPRQSRTTQYLEVKPKQKKSRPDVMKILEASAAEGAKAAREYKDRKSIVDNAKALKGIKYRHKQESPETGFDCSHFVHYVYKNSGRDYEYLPALEPISSWKSHGFEVTNTPKPGDVIYFLNDDGGSLEHVGIVVDPEKGEFIHAEAYREKVITSNWNEYPRRKRQYRRVFLTRGLEK